MIKEKYNILDYIAATIFFLNIKKLNNLENLKEKLPYFHLTRKRIERKC